MNVFLHFERMAALMQKGVRAANRCLWQHVHYKIERILSINQRPKETKRKMIDVQIIKLVCEKIVEKGFMEHLFYGVCVQVVNNKSMARHVLSKDHFAKINKLVRKTFSCKFCDIYVFQTTKIIMKVDISVRMVKLTYFV